MTTVETRFIKIGPNCPPCRGQHDLVPREITELCAVHIEVFGRIMEARGCTIQAELVDEGRAWDV